MIVLRAVRVEDSGAETELGEVRLTEVGAVFSHLSTAEGAGVIEDLRTRLQDERVAFKPGADGKCRCVRCARRRLYREHA